MGKKFKFLLILLGLLCFNNVVLADEYYDLKAEVLPYMYTVNPGKEFTVNVGICNTSVTTTVTHRTITFYYDGTLIEACNTDAEDECVTYHKGWKWSLSSKYQNTKDAYIKAELEATNEDDYIKPNTTCADNSFVSLIKYKFRIKNINYSKNTSISVIDDNGQKRTIDLNVYAKSNDAYLSGIKLNNGSIELSPEFNRNKTEYEAYVSYDVDKIDISAEKSNIRSNVVGTGESALEIGDNNFKLIVTAEDGTKMTYNVNVIRKRANDDTSISKIAVTDSNKKKINLKYDSKTNTYSGNVSEEVTFVTFDIKCSGTDCFVSELEPELVKEGTNEFKFYVISQKGDKQEYKILINKAFAKKDNTVLYLSIGLGVCFLLCIILLILYLKKKA